MSKGILYVFSAPSGCGKGTVLNELFKRLPDIHYSVSATTRAPRDGEVNGKSYYFITKDEFNNLIKTNGMLEYASFCGNYYGTPKKKIMECLENGQDVILEIETAGAMMVKAVHPEAVLIFMLPPSVEELKNRLIGRGTEDMDTILRRVGEASREIQLSRNYDFVFVNDKLDEAVDTLTGIIKYSKNLTGNNIDLIKGVLEQC